MADFRPFCGLRYRRETTGDLGDVLAPPFDVIDAESQAALHQRSPYNIIRLELGEQRPQDDEQENRYTRAAAALQDWRRSGAMALEEEPAFYLYVQEFEHVGKRLRRTALFGRLRLEPWEAGVMRPHEQTMRGPKEDRLRLLRQLRTNVSPIFALYHDPEGSIASLLANATPLIDAETPDGQHHSLAALSDGATAEHIAAALRDRPLYMLDGHHRYETALAYRDERRAATDSWTGEEPENFAMVAITSVEDPGLVLLPTHRLVRPPTLPPDLPERLQRFFHVEDTTPKSYDGTAVLRLLDRLSAAAPGVALGALGLEERRLHLLTLRDADAVRALMPGGSAVWQGLDVNVLEYAVLRETLGLDATPGDAIGYTEDATQALREVDSGRWPLAFLLNPTPVEQILAVADSGERTPPKATYFYPKLATGLVINPFD